MAMQPAVCTNCGGSLNVDDINLEGFCKCDYCGTQHKVIDVITIDGLPTLKSLLATAELYAEDGNHEKAVNTYREALKIKPNCHQAWWGLYVSNTYFNCYYGYTDKYGNSGPVTKANIMLNTINQYAKRAIEYAPPDQACRYEAAIQDDIDFINQVRNSDNRGSETRSSSSEGCYIATAVYGSYNCPQVLTLRRFRDDYLAKSVIGRAFIRTYYRLSPPMARHIKPTSPVGRLIRKLLDKLVRTLSMS